MDVHLNLNTELQSLVVLVLREVWVNPLFCRVRISPSMPFVRALFQVDLPLLKCSNVSSPPSRRSLRGIVMQEKFPHYITPASCIVKAFNMFIDDDSLSGKVAECVIDRIYLRDQHPVIYYALRRY